MSSRVDRLADELLELTPAERIELLDRLATSEDSTLRYRQEWIDAARRRLREVDDHTTALVDAGPVVERLRARIG